MGAAPVLTILKNGETIRSVPIEGEAMLGRSEGCVIRLEDRAISRQHAVFRRKGDQIQVEKKSEFAPLVVNGAECTQAVLKEGDVISIGPYLMRLSMSQAAPAQAQAQVQTPTPAPEKPEPVQSAVEEPVPELMNIADLQSAGSSIDLEVPAEEALPLAEAPASDVPISPASEEGVFSLESPAELPLSPEGSVDEGEKTRVVERERPEIRLLFAPGLANVTEYKIDKDEVSIGRGKDCDIVLNDKKASRKNAIIRRNGMSFVIQDLSSSNGTYLNGEKVQQKELSGGDVIRIGDAEFSFNAEQPGYADQVQNFLAVPPPDESSKIIELPAFSFDPMAQPLVPSPEQKQPEAAFVAPLQMETPVTGAPLPAGAEIAGIAGVAGASATPGKRKGLMEKFRALPKRQQYIVIVLVIAGCYLFLFDEQAPVKKPKGKPKTAQSGTPADGSATTDKAAAKAFAALTPQQKKFVEQKHDLAFAYYSNRKYDEALNEIREVFKLVNDYKDSREIERYALKGKREMEAIAEEKRKRDAEAALKQKVADLLNEGRVLMSKKDYEKASKIFSEILALDPENAQVGQWQSRIQQYEEDKRIEAQKRAVAEEINRQAWIIYNEGLDLRKQGKLREAITVFGKIKEVGASDPKVNRLALGQIRDIKAEIQGRLEPLLKEAREASDGGEYVKALGLYRKVLTVEPGLIDAEQAIERIKKILNERAKALYTEGVLAESYSDFATAKRKFQQIIETAPSDSIYRDRAERKLARYFRQEESPSQ